MSLRDCFFLGQFIDLMIIQLVLKIIIRLHETMTNCSCNWYWCESKLVEIAAKEVFEATLCNFFTFKISPPPHVDCSVSCIRVNGVSLTRFCTV